MKVNSLQALEGRAGSAEANFRAQSADFRLERAHLGLDRGGPLENKVDEKRLVFIFGRGPLEQRAFL